MASTNGHLTNVEIAQCFQKYMKLSFYPLGMYFAEKMPEAKVRTQGRLIGRCVVSHVFKAAKSGGISLLQEGGGCPGGQFWTGFSKQLPHGWAQFITKGRKDILDGRAEHFKKDVNVATGAIRDPGPIDRPTGTNYIVYQPLKDIRDDQKIEFILFFVKPDKMAELISLTNFARHDPYLVKAPQGSGCMSILNFPLKMKQAPEPDGVMGIWDPFSRTTIAEHTLTLALRRWLVEEMALNMPESFLAHKPAPFTIKGEIWHFLKKLKKGDKEC
ncbi:MAG: DUF169 domain-containing protein [Candidatus Helarchaeota archaeon]|nr:DUF169 domain-containing protein [Candidatus Helarchaeota archaeon]